MALRLLPFRQYIEQDVINLYSLDETAPAAGFVPDTNGFNDAGVLVSVHNGDFDAGIDYSSDSYLGKTDYPHIGANGYPKVTGMQIQAFRDGGEAPLGITLRQTLTHDENGEKLLYYRQKMIELQAVLPGEVVPVLTRGVITLDSSAILEDDTNSVGFGDTLYAVDATALGTGAVNAGKLTDANTSGIKVGKVLAVGSRKAGLTADQFAGDSGSSSKYYTIKIEL